jgi:hypothetical protein
MDDKQQAVIDSLIESGCNKTLAINENGIDLKTFYEWLKIDEFREGYDTAIQVRDDEALTSFMDLVRSGDRGASIEYQKMQRQREDLNEIKRTKREVMRVLIESQETKAACMREYCHIFKCTKSASEDQFANVVAEFGLKTPHQRMKEKSTKQDNLMSTLFDEGKLSETDMYSRMLSKALYDSEASEYPSERSKARADVISINQRLEEINERQRRESESDDTPLVEKLDAVLSGVKPDEVAALKQSFIAGPMAIEVTEDVKS